MSMTSVEAADARRLRHAGLVLLWAAAAAAERLVQLPAGLRFPGLLLLAVLVTAWHAGRAGAAAAIAAASTFQWFAMRDVGSGADVQTLVVFAVVATIAASLTLALRCVRDERDVLQREVAALRASAGDVAEPSPETAQPARDAAQDSFAAFMAAFPYPAFIQDEHGHYVFVNEAGRLRTGWLDAASPGGGPEGVARSPSDRHFFSIRFPLDIAGRSLLGGIAIDVTQLKEYEAELKLAVRRRDEFLAVLAHELRNPLTPVQHSVQILNRVPGDIARVRKATVTIDRQVARMERLIADLLDVARISQGLVALEPEPRPLDALVDGAIDTVRPHAERTGHRFEVCHESPGASAHVDALRAEQILVNLLSNAIKYSPNGSTVRITTGVEGGLCRIAVADEGRGILPEHLRDIFTMFARPGEGGRPRSAGMGVGLALSRQLAEQHGGRIEVTSPGPGLGATFTVWLPRAAQCDDPAGYPSREAGAAPATRHSLARGT